MAIGFGNTPLQQRIIKKVQDQASQKTSTKREANSADIEKFKTHMGDRGQEVVKDDRNQEENPPAIEAAKTPSAGNEQVPTEQDNQVSQANSDVASAEQSGSSAYKSPGDQILETLENMSAGVKQVDNIAPKEATRS